MRMMLGTLAVAALAASAPALAAPPIEGNADQIAQEATRVLTDPRTEQTIGQAMRVLTDTLLDMKVGEIKALVEGRKVTAADQALTVRDLARRDDPQFEARMRARMDSARPLIQQQAKALASSIPVLMKSAEQMARSMERLSANLPDPTYPKR